MIKPISVSVKDWLIAQTAKELEIDESLYEKVVNWSYLKAREATRDNRSVELSGFGKLIVSKKKTSKRLAGAIGRLKTLQEETFIPNPERYALQIELTKQRIEFLKDKLNEPELEADNRGMEE